MLLRAFLILALPAVALLGGFAVFKSLHQQQTIDGLLASLPPQHAKPLNQRYGGYNAAKAGIHWDELRKDPKGIPAARFLLAIDLVFPLVYGAAIAAALVIAWWGFGWKFHPGWLIAPVAVVIVADWTENVLHLSQIDSASLSASWIGVASIATQVKLIGASILCPVVGVLALWMSLRPGRG